MENLTSPVRVGFCLTGSFCTFKKAIDAMERLKNGGYDIIPIMSFNAANTDTRFGTATQHIEHIEDICGRHVIRTIPEAEPIGPKNMTDVMLVAPCTGNTLAKLAHSMTDTPVVMAVKSHLRGGRPVIIAPATNDGLAGAFKNLAMLMNYRHYYFVPFTQDDCVKKPNSLGADLSKLEETIEAALNGVQIQPVLV
ncbi:MAG: dipicolinate synthase subunit B [Eubacterium sp.]|nr:dipicolinate synthase subunit B [Eubacterium sp.]